MIICSVFIQRSGDMKVFPLRGYNRLILMVRSFNLQQVLVATYLTSKRKISGLLI